MLTSDGLSLEMFTSMWRDAMWSAVDTDERVRLVLELGRATLRDRGTVTPQMVAFTSDLDPPFSIFQLPLLVRTRFRSALTEIHVRRFSSAAWRQ